MAQQLQLRKGTTAQHSGFVGAIGEVTVDTTRKSLRVHDGVTAGGWEVGARLPDGVKTVYIAARTDGREGSGTETDPYDAGGSTPSIAADKYDAIYSNRTKCPTGCVIKLMAGQYYTKGCEYYPENYGGVRYPCYPFNSSLIGNGIANTTLTYIGDASTTRNCMIRIYCQNWGQQTSAGAGQFSVVSDLTVDGNWQNMRKANAAISGIFILSPEIGLIERVWAKNFGGDYNTAVESFVLNASGWKFGIVRNCICTDPVNSISQTGGGGQPYITWISGTGQVVRVDLTGTDYYYKSVGCGIMYGNVVIGGTTLYPHSTFAYGLFGQTVFCHNNYAYRCFYAGHCDTGVHDAVWIYNNRFEDCAISISFNMDGIYNKWNFIHVTDNQIILPDFPSPSTYYGAIRAINTKKTVQMSRNLITMVNDAAGVKYTPWRIEQADTCIIRDNIVNTRSSGFGGTNVKSIDDSNNRDEDGILRFDFSDFSRKKALYVSGLHSTPQANGKELGRAIAACYNGTIYLPPATYLLAQADIGYNYNGYRLVGMGRPQDTIVDTSHSDGWWMYSLGGDFSAENITITSNAAMTQPDRIVLSLKENGNNRFFNCIFKLSSNPNTARNLVNGGYLRGYFENCEFQGTITDSYNGGLAGWGQLEGTLINCKFNEFVSYIANGSVIDNCDIIVTTKSDFIVLRGAKIKNSRIQWVPNGGRIIVDSLTSGAEIVNCHLINGYIQLDASDKVFLRDVYIDTGANGTAIRSNNATVRTLNAVNVKTQANPAVSNVTINTLQTIA